MQAIDIIWSVAERLESPETLQTEPTPELTSWPRPTHWVENYWVKDKGYWYYRYVWMEGQKLHHVHIPGGNIRSGVSRGRAALVESMIQAGWSSSLIEQHIKQWRPGRNGNERTDRSN